MCWTDARDTPITVGAEVFYNLSGDAAKGRVVATPPSENIFKIELLFPVGGMPTGHISKVKNSNSILVLKQSACPNCGQDPLHGEY